MAEGIKNLRKIQFGLEGTKGTETNATIVWRGTGTIEDARETVFVEEDVGFLPGTDRTMVPSVLGKLTFDDTPATFGHLPYILECGIKAIGTGVADSTGSGKLYTYTLPTMTTNTIKSATIEGGDNAGEEQMLYSFVEAFTIKGASKEAVMVSADWVGRQVAPGTFTTSLAPVAVEELFFGKSLLYIDTSGGTFGGTVQAATLLGFELNATTGWVPLFSGDGQLYFTVEKNVGPEITLSVTFEHDTLGIAQVAAYRAETERLVRIKVEGSALTTPGIYTYRTLVIDLAGKWESFEKIAEIDGNDIRTGVLRGRYNVTATDYGKIVVVNQTTTL